MGPLLIFPEGYLLKFFPKGVSSARQRGLKIRAFPLLVDYSLYIIYMLKKEKLMRDAAQINDSQVKVYSKMAKAKNNVM